MTRPLQLETFRVAPQDVPAPDAAQLMQARQQGYEAGHRAGWDACEAAARAAGTDLREAVGTHLQALAFTYQEAQEHVLRGLKPLLQEMTAKVLPQLAHQMLLPRIVEQLHPLVAEGAAHPVTIRVAPTQLEAAEAFLSVTPGHPFRVAPGTELGPGQAILATGQTEQKIDLDGAITAMSAAVTEFLETHWLSQATHSGDTE